MHVHINATNALHGISNAFPIRTAKLHVSPMLK